MERIKINTESYIFFQMRDLVTKRSYLFRKKLDELLYWMLPNTWVPLYNSVSFSHMRYSKCIANRKWQDKVLFVDILNGLKFTIILLFTFSFQFRF